MECLKGDEIGKGGKVYIKVEKEEYFDSNDAVTSPEESIHQLFMRGYRSGNYFRNTVLLPRGRKSGRSRPSGMQRCSAWLVYTIRPTKGENWSVEERNGSVNSKSCSIGVKRMKNDSKKVNSVDGEVTGGRESCIVEIKTELVQEEVSDTTSCQNELKEHILSGLEAEDNSKKTTFECSFCWKEFAFKSRMIQHLKTHTGEKPFKCELCEYRTSDRSNLKTHMRKHTGEKPFKCNHCEYKTSFNASLKSHLRTHTGEKPFKCEYCEYRTADSSSIRTHLRTHTVQTSLCLPSTAPLRSTSLVPCATGGGPEKGHHQKNPSSAATPRGANLFFVPPHGE
ncbi:hypothetical protein J437_LFUL010508 [Ladona fulva]|uniref:C2H2-type domain-containing protein n=1 Tax=Ladona fulva TaxID=123851 RepID=A0A8K0P3E5_LADFU|nr:hypothetical protein J437_LFUL010508 [Ladona fulva]